MDMSRCMSELLKETKRVLRSVDTNKWLVEGDAEQNKTRRAPMIECVTGEERLAERDREKERYAQTRSSLGVVAAVVVVVEDRVVTGT